jgi:uncharacterized protein (TIGR02001 family)
MATGYKLLSATLALSGALLTTGASAQGSLKDAPAAPAEAAREFKINFNVGVTSDYIFRGVSQNGRNPALQGGVDVTYGIAYAGIWASAVKFGNPWFTSAEIDLYAGIKPVWKSSFGDLNFDFGTIYYGYAGGNDKMLNGKTLVNVPKPEYYEFKASVNRDLWKDANLASTIFFSPNSQFETGKVWTSETTFSQTFAAWGKVVPLFAATIGNQRGSTDEYKSLIANGKSGYVYGNAGVTFTYDEKISLDFRYWATNISNANGFCTGEVFQCGPRAMATLKFTW